MKQLGLYPVKHAQLSIGERLHLTAQAGFDYVCAASIEQLIEPGAAGFRASAAREHLPIDNVHLTGSDTNKVWYPGSEGDAIIARYRREMELALQAGVDLGVVHVTWGFQTPPLSDIGMERFKKLIGYAESIGFTIAFENSVSLAHYSAVLDQIPSENVCFCFDSGHWNEFCPDAEIYQRYGSRMRITHINDNDGKHDLHIIPFDGCTDFGKLAPALKRMDKLTFEVSGALDKTCPESKEALSPDFSRMRIWEDASLLDVRDGGFRIYNNLSYEAYLHRLMQSAVKLRDQIEAAP